MSKRIHRVFVYGTLKQGKYFHDEYLGGDKSTALGPATASLDYSMYNDGLPHLVRETTDKPVKGELYEVDAETLEKLDGLEGHPVVYYREIIEVYDGNNKKLLAWAYLRPKHFKGKQYAHKEEEFI